MKRLLNIEFQKMRYNRATKILVAIYFILFFGMALFSSIHFKFGNVDFRLADQGIFNFPYIWHFSTYIIAGLKLFLALVIIGMTTLEYSNRTLKQNLIDGLSKREFILSKFYAILAFSIASTALVFVVALILGLCFSSYTEIGIIFSGMQYLVGYLLKLIAFFSFCLFLGVWLKKTAFALGALFIWYIFEGICFLLLSALGVAPSIKSILLNFLPLNAMSNLVPEPFSDMGIIKSTLGVASAPVLWYYWLIAIGWTAIFSYGAYRLLQKRDL